MKRLTVAIVFVLAGTAQLFAQEYEYVPFPDSGAVWSEIFYCHDENAVDKTTYENFAVNGEDTLMSNQIYTKLYLFYDSIFNKATATCIGGIREDSLRRIYYNGIGIHRYKPNLECANENNEIKLFDFGLEVGDTVWSLNSGYSANGLIVSRIDTLLLGNSLRRKINFGYFDSFDPFWSFSWVEGIGSTRGLLYVSDETPMSYLNHLICYKQYDKTIFKSEFYNDCFPNLTGFSEKAFDNKVKIYPNPITNNEAKFVFNGLNVESISIYNEYGCFITSIDVRGLNNAIIPLTNIASGIYLYVIFTRHGNLVSGKFMVQ